MAKQKKAKQPRLPSMEDPEIEALESLAEDYAEARDERLAFLEKEVSLKEAILDEMHRRKKTRYQHDGLSIEIVPEGETVKVKVRKEKEEAA